MPARPAGTRSRLLSAASRLFWQRSYASVGVDELCAAAGANKGSLYHFFAGKLDLVLAAIQLNWSNTRIAVFERADRDSREGLDKVRQVIGALEAEQRAAQEQTSALLGSRFGGLGHELGHLDARVRLAVHAVFEEQCGYFERWLGEAVRLRQIPSGDNHLRARQILALLEGALLLAKVSGDVDRFAELCAAVPIIAGRSPASPPVRAVPPELL
jgi:TetR/AcrR family transcriptional repressor of nem operon